MKKTLDINLSGRMFHVDEDAYQLLYDYLYNLRHAFERQEGGNEIMDDLENRLAELLLERISDRQEVVSRTIVQENPGERRRPRRRSRPLKTRKLRLIKKKRKNSTTRCRPTTIRSSRDANVSSATRTTGCWEACWADWRST